MLGLKEMTAKRDNGKRLRKKNYKRNSDAFKVQHNKLEDDYEDDTSNSEIEEEPVIYIII